MKPNFLEDSDCRWLGVEKRCAELFTEIITDEGICYSFNLLDRKEMFRNETFEGLMNDGNMLLFIILVQYLRNFKTSINLQAIGWKVVVLTTIGLADLIPTWHHYLV